MRAIRLTNEMKVGLVKTILDQLDGFIDDKISLEIDMSQKPENKLKIYYSAEAYAKIVQLVFSHKDEIGWNMVIKPYLDGYKVYDVLVYPQKASGAYIEVDLARYALWKADPDQVSDEADANLFGQGHSHVMMGVTPSGRDTTQQKDEVQLKKSGFYLFQIWNKRMEINSFFYDIDNNLLYEKDDIELIVEEGNVNSKDFIKDSHEKLIVEEKKPEITKLGKTDKPKDNTYLDKNYYPDWERAPERFYDF